MARVASLMREWAEASELDEADVARWTSLGYLHDALRGANPDQLRPLVDAPFRDLDGRMLHGPAAARRLADEGVDDQALLDAVTFHTLGYAGFGPMGQALYAADFLEPGRSFRRGWRTRLRNRMPREAREVVLEILAARVARLVERKLPIRPETMTFWNSLVGEEAWAGASAR